MTTQQLESDLRAARAARREAREFEITPFGRRRRHRTRDRFAGFAMAIVCSPFRLTSRMFRGGWPDRN